MTRFNRLTLNCQGALNEKKTEQAITVPCVSGQNMASWEKSPVVRPEANSLVWASRMQLVGILQRRVVALLAGLGGFVRAWHVSNPAQYVCGPTWYRAVRARYVLGSKGNARVVRRQG
jgi:hypothetical protein